MLDRVCRARRTSHLPATGRFHPTGPETVHSIVDVSLLAISLHFVFSRSHDGLRSSPVPTSVLVFISHSSPYFGVNTQLLHIQHAQLRRRRLRFAKDNHTPNRIPEAAPAIPRRLHHHNRLTFSTSTFYTSLLSVTHAQDGAVCQCARLAVQQTNF